MESPGSFGPAHMALGSSSWWWFPEDISLPWPRVMSTGCPCPTLPLCPGSLGHISPSQQHWKPCSISTLRAEEAATAPQSAGRDHFTSPPALGIARGWVFQWHPPCSAPQPQALCGRRKAWERGGGCRVCLDACGMQMADDKMLEAGAGRSCHRRLAALV